jgi:GT2 family glycosyltransferase
VTAQRKQPLVSIVAINFNQLQLTVQFLESIRRQDYQNVEVFIVDNASRENPSAFLKAHFPEVNLIVSEKNLGFAGGNNLAMPHVRGEYVFFVNNDTELTDGCLAKLVQLFKVRPKLGVASPLICYFPTDEDRKANREIIQYVGMTAVNALTARNRTLGEKEINTQQYRFALPTAYAHGAAMLVKRAVFEKAGLMWNDFFLYYEELDWCERIKRAGFEIWVEPNAKIYHKESASVGALSSFKTFYINRNRILFMRRNFGGIKFLAYLFFLIFVSIPVNSLFYDGAVFSFTRFLACGSLEF